MGSPTDPPPQPSASSAQAEHTLDGFKGAFDTYLAGEGSVAQVREQWELVVQAPGRRDSLVAFVQRLREGSGPPDEAELRILDVCVALGEEQLYLTELNKAGRRVDLIDPLHTYIEIRRLDEPAALARLADSLSHVADYAGRPNVLGRLVLTYLPDHFDDLLHYMPKRPGWFSWALDGAPFVSLVRLLLATQPPLVDAALRAAQQAPRDQVGNCIVYLLQAAPERVQEWAREVAGPQSPATRYGRRLVLEQLLAIDAHAHRDLAVEALHSGFGPLATVGLEAIFQTDPAGSLPVIEEIALHGPYAANRRAVELLAEADFRMARPVLQRCVAAAKDSDVRVKALKILLAQEWDGRDTYVCSLFAHRAPWIRNAAADEVARWGEAAISLIVPFLGHPQARARFAAARALLKGGSERGRALLATQLAKEPSPTVRREIVAALGLPPPELASESGLLVTPEAVVHAAQLESTRSKRTRQWWFAKNLAPEDAAGACWRTGEPLPAVVVHYLLYCQSCVAGWDAALDTRVRQILALVDRASTVDLANAIFDAWRAWDAPTRESWCLPLVCALADVTVAERVLRQAWIEWDDRIRLAQRILRALALVDDEAIFSKISDIANDITGRHRHLVVQAAWQTLQDAAIRRQFPLEEFLDRAATRPDWGTSRTCVYDHGSETYTAQFTSDLRWHIRDDTGMRLRAIPRPSRFSDNELARKAHWNWATLRSQVRLAVLLQTDRLMHALMVERTWSVSVWQEIFLHHPLMRLLAMNLVWAVGDPESGEIAATFQPTDDGTLVAADDQAIDLPVDVENGAVIWLVHPVQLNMECRQAWIAHLARTRRRPPFRQLDCPVARVRPEERDAIACTRWAGRIVDGRALHRQGWNLDWSIGTEVGTYGSMYRLFQQVGSPNLQAVLEVELLTGPTSYNAPDRQRIVRLVFRSAETSGHHPHHHSALPTESTECIRLGAVPLIIFSEAVTDVEQMVAAAELGQPDEGALAAP